jgi:hypothetical protein
VSWVCATCGTLHHLDEGRAPVSQEVGVSAFPGARERVQRLVDALLESGIGRGSRYLSRSRAVFGGRHVDSDLAADRVGDEARLVRSVVELMEGARGHLAGKPDARAECDVEESLAVHQALGVVLIREDAKPLSSREVQKPEHMTGRERRDKEFLRVGLLRVTAQILRARTVDPLAGKLDLVSAQIAFAAMPRDVSAMPSSLAHLRA